MSTRRYPGSDPSVAASFEAMLKNAVKATAIIPAISTRKPDEPTDPNVEQQLLDYAEGEKHVANGAHQASLVNCVLYRTIMACFPKSGLSAELAEMMKVDKITPARATDSGAWNKYEDDFVLAVDIENAQDRETAMNEVFQKVKNDASSKYANRLFSALFLHPAYTYNSHKPPWQQLFAIAHDWIRTICNARHDLLCRTYLGNAYTTGTSVLYSSEYISPHKGARAQLKLSAIPLVEVRLRADADDSGATLRVGSDTAKERAESVTAKERAKSTKEPVEAMTSRVVKESDHKPVGVTASRIPKRRHVIVLSEDEDDSVPLRRRTDRGWVPDSSRKVVKVEEVETDTELELELAEIELKKKMLQLESEALVLKRRKMKLRKT